MFDAPLLISLLALLISTISLWKGYLTPFKLNLTHSTPSLTLYNMGEFWIPSINLSITAHNTGKRPGELSDVRIRVKSKTNPGGIEVYPFEASWIVDYSKFHSARGDRFEWIRNSVIREWYPVRFEANAEKTFHIVLEGLRWKAPFEAELEMILEIHHSGSWHSLGRYSYPIEESNFSDHSSYSPLSQLSAIRQLPRNDWFSHIDLGEG